MLNNAKILTENRLREDLKSVAVFYFAFVLFVAFEPLLL